MYIGSGLDDNVASQCKFTCEVRQHLMGFLFSIIDRVIFIVNFLIVRFPETVCKLLRKCAENGDRQFQNYLVDEKFRTVLFEKVR